MRVAIDARSLSERFTSNYTYWSELVAALGRREDVELLLVSNGDIPAVEVPKNARVIVEPANGRWFSYAVLPRIARRERADIAHIQYTVSPRFELPVVTMVHDVSFFIEPTWFGRKDRWLLQKTVPAACRRASRVLVPSVTCREELLSYIDVVPEKVVVTPEGTPTRLLDIEPKGIERIIGDHPYVLLVGGASPRKNLAGAMEAVRLARKVLPDLRLLVTGSLNADCSDDFVVAPGPLDEAVLAAAYRKAHALLHPSYHEGFGLTLLEAMALGCPVVASDRGAIPEVAGDAAILCNANDASAMADGIVSLTNPAVREEMIRRGAARAAEFTWDRTADLTVQAYRQAIGHS